MADQTRDQYCCKAAPYSFEGMLTLLFAALILVAELESFHRLSKSSLMAYVPHLC
jgi:hypothetical protein